MKLRVEDLLASSLSLKNENQLLRGQVDNLKQSFRLEMREKDLELRKMEDDFHWRRGREAENSESLLKGVDLLQLENMDLKRDVDSLRALVEEKDERVRTLQLERARQQRVADDLNAGGLTRSGNAQGAQPQRKSGRRLQSRLRGESAGAARAAQGPGADAEVLFGADGEVHAQLRAPREAGRGNEGAAGHRGKGAAQGAGGLPRTH